MARFGYDKAGNEIIKELEKLERERDEYSHRVNELEYERLKNKVLVNGLVATARELIEDMKLEFGPNTTDFPGLLMDSADEVLAAIEAIGDNDE